MNPTGQISLSANFKMQTSDAPAVIEALLEDKHFVSFDYDDWFTIDRVALEALAARLQDVKAARNVADIKNEL